MRATAAGRGMQRAEPTGWGAVPPRVSVPIPFMGGDPATRKTLLHGTLTQDEHRIRVKALYRASLHFIVDHIVGITARFKLPQKMIVDEHGLTHGVAITARDVQHEFRSQMHLTCAEDIEGRCLGVLDTLEMCTLDAKYMPPTFPGGTKYMRNVPPPLEVVNATPRAWNDPRGMEIDNHGTHREPEVSGAVRPGHNGTPFNSRIEGPRIYSE